MSPVETPAAGTGRRFFAFISYSHRDADFVKWLHGALETYVIPGKLRGRATPNGPVPERLMPIFRDRDELPSAASLSDAIRSALAQSSALIVVCSPDASRSRWVDEEVRTFKAMGRASRVFAVLVDTAGPEAVLDGCAPPSLLHALDASGSIDLGRPAEPLAADARPGKDGRRDALLKLVAGIAGVGFDELKRREGVRQTARRRRLALAAMAGIAAVTLAYIGAADAGLGLPRADTIRDAIDDRRSSLFRKPVPPEAVEAAVARFGTEIRPRLLEGVDPERNVRFRQEWPGTNGAWEGSQTLAALLSDPQLPVSEIPRLVSLQDRLFDPSFLVVSRTGVVLGWWDNQKGEHARAEPTFWVAIGLMVAIERGHDLPAEMRAGLVRKLRQAQDAAELLFDPSRGSWASVPRQLETRGATYVSALALHAVLKALELDLGWRGDGAQARMRAEKTVRWFEESFIEGGKSAGWGRDPGDEDGANNELTLMVHGVLARAHVLLGRRLPPAIEKAGLAEMSGLADRRFTHSGIDLNFWGNFQGDEGPKPFRLSSRHLWYPWALLAAADWIAYAKSQPLAPRALYRLERSYTHLAAELIEAVQRDLLDDRTALYRFAETSYAVAEASARRARSRSDRP